jgi:hypothetical protein
MDDAIPSTDDIPTERGSVMKTPTRIICMAMAAFFAFAASAQAADQWYTSTTQLGTFTTIPVGTSKAISGTSGVSTFAVPALGFTTECKKDSFTGSIQNVATPVTVEAHITTKLTFEECQIKGVSTSVCQVRSVGNPNGKVTTVELTGKINTSTGANKPHVLFSPKSGSVIYEKEILGEECAFLQASPVKTTGALEGSLSPQGNVATQKAVLPFPSPALSGSTLNYGGNSATFVGTETAELESKEWVNLK